VGGPAESVGGPAEKLRGEIRGPLIGREWCGALGRSLNVRSLNVRRLRRAVLLLVVTCVVAAGVWYAATRLRVEAQSDVFLVRPGE